MGGEPQDHRPGRLALRQEDDVLDVGCGVGRVAIGLTTYLTGRYEGFDVDPELVAWCQENISPRYPNFRFTHVNVFNGTYNPQGAPARESVFPYPDASFDLIVGFSIFTHLLPEDANHYLSESRRVLRRGGRLLFTFFLLGPKTRATLSRGGTIADALLERYDGDFATAYEQPEALVAYRQGYIREACERLGFEVTSIRHGNWPDWAIDQRADCTQDVVLASLPDRAP